MNSEELYQHIVKLKNDIDSHYKMLYSNDAQYKAKNMKNQGQAKKSYFGVSTPPWADHSMEHLASGPKSF